MQVAVEDAGRVDLAEEVPDDVRGGRVEVVPRGGQPLRAGLAVGAQLADDVDERQAVEALGGEHPARGVVEVDLRDVLGVRVADVVADRDGVRGLDLVVELLARPAGELVDDLPRAGRAQHVRAVDERGDAAHERDVAHEQQPDPGTLHLDGDAAAVVQDRVVHLPDRRAPERLVLERREDVVRGPPELLANDPLDVGVRERRCAVEQLEELKAVRLGQQVEAQREQLAELRPRAAERLERAAQPDGSGSAAPASRHEQRQQDAQQQHAQHLDQPPDRHRAQHRAPRANCPLPSRSHGAVIPAKGRGEVMRLIERRRLCDASSNGGRARGAWRGNPR